MSIKVVHILESVSSGGASRNTLALAHWSNRLANMAHSVVSLGPASDQGIDLASFYDVPLVIEPNDYDLIELIKTADIVQVSYWNCPRITAFLNMDLPPTRLSIWFRIFGAFPPQVITSELLAFADVPVMTCYRSLELPVIKKSQLIEKYLVVPGPADFSRLAGLTLKQHDKYNVGYIGTVDFVKMNSNYVYMSSRVDVPSVQFLVYGTGTLDNSSEHRLQEQVRELGIIDKFGFYGYCEDIRFAISEFDIFGYPLCAETYATSEACIQEVMYAGIPPVVFPYGGLTDLVINGETGIVVQTEDEYVNAIEHLFHHFKERKRLGNNASIYARKHMGANNAAVRMNAIYQTMMSIPKRNRKILLYTTTGINNYSLRISSESNCIGASLFALSLGVHGIPFLRSLSSPEEDIVNLVEDAIAQWPNSNLMTSLGFGSVFHYSSAYPGDVTLHLWCGMLLVSMGKFHEAKERLTLVIKLDSTNKRAYDYLEHIETQIVKASSSL